MKKSVLFLMLMVTIFFSCDRSEEEDTVDGGEVLNNPIDFWKNTSQVSTDPKNVVINKLFTYNDSYILAGTDSGIYRSVNFGAKWKHFLAEKTGINSFCQTSSGIIFAGSDGNGIYQSSDAGVSWINSGLSGKTVQSLASKEDIGTFAGTLSGVYKFNPVSDEWNSIGLIDTIILCLEIDDNGYLYAGTSGKGVLRLNAQGQWIKTKMDIGQIADLKIYKNNSLLVSLWGQGLFILSDNGTKLKSTGIGQPNYVYGIAVDTLNNIFTSHYDIGILASADEGVTWSVLNSGLNADQNQSIVCTRGGQLFTASDNHGVYSANYPSFEFKNILSS